LVYSVAIMDLTIISFSIIFILISTIVLASGF
jgi:hypothetical protein